MSPPGKGKGRGHSYSYTRQPDSRSYRNYGAGYPSRGYTKEREYEEDRTTHDDHSVPGKRSGSSASTTASAASGLKSTGKPNREGGDADRMDESSSAKRGARTHDEDNERARPAKVGRSPTRETPQATAQPQEEMRPPTPEAYVPPGHGFYPFPPPPATHRIDAIEDVWEAIDVHTRAIKDLQAYVRSRKQREQWCITIPCEAQFEGLREDLRTAKEKWNKDRPERGRHLSGPLHAVLWRIFSLYMSEALFVEATRQKPLSQAFMGIDPESDHNKVSEFCAAFYHLGKKLQQDKEWRFIFVPNLSISAGRQLHETFYTSADTSEANTGIIIYPDRAPLTGSERAVLDMQ